MQRKGVGIVGEDVKKAREIRPEKFVNAERKCLPTVNYCVLPGYSKQQVYIHATRKPVNCHSYTTVSWGVRTAWPALGYTEINMIPVKANAPSTADNSRLHSEGVLPSSVRRLLLLQRSTRLGSRPATAPFTASW